LYYSDLILLSELRTIMGFTSLAIAGIMVYYSLKKLNRAFFMRLDENNLQIFI